MAQFSFIEHEDDQNVGDGRYFFKKRRDETTIEHDYLPVFSYDHLDIDKTIYCFSQGCLDNTDIVEYFRKVKRYSSTTIGELLNQHHTEHFHLISPIPRELRELIRDISGKRDLNDEHLPPLGQFGLYTSPQGADRNTTVKSPRIFFFIGNYGIIYILFYDPYHEIYKGKKK